MIKRYIENFIRKYKNSSFSFDDELTISMLVSFSLDKFISHLRSYKLLFFFRFTIFNFYGTSVKFKNLSKIKLGKWVQLDDYVYLNGLGRGFLTIGDKTNIGAFTRIIVSTSYNNLGEFIHIGNNVGIGEYSRIGGSGGVSIGDNTIIDPNCTIAYSIIGSNVKIHNGVRIGQDGFGFAQNENVNLKMPQLGRVLIKDNVEIGSNCSIDRGTGPDTIIGEGTKLDNL